MPETEELPQPVNWEAVRMLAVVVGVRESARRMGLNEEAVKRRCTREGWLKSPEARMANKNAIAARSGLTAPQMSPMAVLAGEMKALGEKTRLGHARAAAAIADHVAQRDAEENLMDMQNVKAAAQHADLVHGWKESAPQVKIRLDVLNGSSPEPVLDVESESVTLSDSWDSSELDDY